MAYSNTSKTSTTTTNQSKNTTSFSLGHSAILKEDMGFLLTEDGDRILLEPETGPKEDVATTYSYQTKNDA